MTVRISPWVRTSIGYRYKGGWGSLSVSSGYWLLVGVRYFCLVFVVVPRVSAEKKVSTYLPINALGGAFINYLKKVSAYYYGTPYY